METTAEAINDIILDISLASSLPIGVKGRDMIRATAATNALACKTLEMHPRELRELEYTIGPLLQLLAADIDNPIAVKAAFGIRALMPSRVCMSRLLSENGLSVVSRTFDALLGSNMIDLKTKNNHRNIIEYLTIIYREIARFYPWVIVKAGALRHCVVLLRFGDIELQTIASGTLASLSTDLEICKQMFSNGAIKPLLNVSDGDVTNEACMLAGLGCIVQLCRIPEIAIRIVQQGAMFVLEKALHRKTGYGIKAIREKALYSLAWLTRVEEVRPQLCTKLVLKGMKRELKSGTMPAKYTIVQMLLNLHNKYDAEAQFVDSVKDIIFDLLNIGPWHARNLCLKAFCVLYRDNETKMYFLNRGILESIYYIIGSKSQDLQEAPLVAILSLSTHPLIPRILLEKACADVVSKFFFSKDDVIREVSVIIMKTFYLYDQAIVNAAIPPERAYLMESGDDMPKLYGSEYGEMIEEYLQHIVENRRDMHYLLEKVLPEDLERLQVTQAELESYQNTFMELDLTCQGTLGIIELKMLMVMLGEELDKDELQDVLDEYDQDKSGSLNFTEFMTMMKGWATRFGTGATKAYNEFTKRGAIGKARREFGKWWNQDKIEAEQVAAAKAKRKAEKDEIKRLAAQHWGDEKMRIEREQEAKRRAKGLSSVGQDNSSP